MPAEIPTPPPPRLVLIVPSFPKLSETFIVSKFLGLLERGWDAYVVCGGSDPAQWQNFPDLAGYPGARERVKANWPHRPQWWAGLLLPFAFFHCLWRNPAGMWHYSRAGIARFGLGMLRRLYLDAMLLALKPDLVHFEFGALAVGKMYVKQLLGCKVTASFRGYDLNLSGWEEPDYFREVWEQTDAVHLLGEGLWRRAQQRGCPPTKLHALIPPAIDLNFFAPQNRVRTGIAADRPLRIVSVGRLTWEKGYDYAVEAIRLLTRQGVRSELRIIGDGGLLESLAFARHQLGVEDSVQFLGARTRAQVREELLDADVFLHASVSEGFGNAVIEAQAMALPVVCSDAGGLPENVADGETGFVVPRRDARALAEKLTALARDPALRQRLGEAGRRRVLGHFESSEQIEAFDQFYRLTLSTEGLGKNNHSAVGPERADAKTSHVRNTI